MDFTKIDLDETHIRLTSDLVDSNLKHYIHLIRNDLKRYININPSFLYSLEPVDVNIKSSPLIVKTMCNSSNIAQVGPMACVAGTISELALDYLIKHGSSYSIVENGGDIALINDKKVLCGIFSNNDILGNNIAFEIKKRKKPLGISSSSAKIGHSISFGSADCVSVVSKSSSIADGLATRIANEAVGGSDEDKIFSALEVADDFKEHFYGVLIISGENVGSVGRLPKIVETNEFEISY